MKDCNIEFYTSKIADLEQKLEGVEEQLKESKYSNGRKEEDIESYKEQVIGLTKQLEVLSLDTKNMSKIKENTPEAQELEQRFKELSKNIAKLGQQLEDKAKHASSSKSATSTVFHGPVVFGNNAKQAGRDFHENRDVYHYGSGKEILTQFKHKPDGVSDTNKPPSKADKDLLNKIIQTLDKAYPSTDKSIEVKNCRAKFIERLSPYQERALTKDERKNLRNTILTELEEGVDSDASDEECNKESKLRQ